MDTPVPAKPVTETAMTLTAGIVSAYASRNSLNAQELPGLITEVFKTMSGLGTEPTSAERPQPAVPVKKSVFADHIVCLEDGKKLKMLKRHLSSAYSMTPEQYRQRWDLPANYPMVAPDYTKQRSKLAKQIGLGTHRGERTPAAAAAATAATTKVTGGAKKATAKKPAAKKAKKGAAA